MIKIVFFGTPDYIVPVLASLHKNFKTRSGESPIVAVVTQPPKPTGRKQKLSYSPVDTWAHKRKVPKYFDSTDLLKQKIHADVGVLASYGAIIPNEVIKHFPNGILNIHPSLLPKWRGASPVQATLAAADKQAGSTIIKIDELMDHGPIVSQFTEEILPDDTTESLRNRLFERSSDVLTALIDPYLKGKIKLREQDHDKATFAKLIKKDHGFIDPKGLKAAIEGKKIKKEWKMEFIKDFTTQYTPFTVNRFIKAMKPWPIAWSLVRIENQEFRIKILKTHLKPSTTNRQSLIIDEVQLEGKNPVSWGQFKEGYSFKF